MRGIVAVFLLSLAAVPVAGEPEPDPGGASWWQRLVEPGPLSVAHADLSKDCSLCHKSFEEKAEASLCLSCHEPVAEDLEAGTGLHGRVPGVRGRDCRTCHSEHQGRDHDLLGLDPLRFDHSLADFALLGAHVRTACASCHPADRKHREAPADCLSCHGEDDAHGGSLGEDCAACHDVSLTDDGGWRSARFDHDATRFPLRGAHAAAECGLCHASADHREAPSDCVSCHRLDDAHRGGFGDDCASCHGTDRWRRVGFDHLAASGFALRGRHADAACASCHVEPPGKRELPSDCGSCHRLDDAHRGAYGADCGSCHSASAWQRATFDHVGGTGFDLLGAHASLTCESCHTVSLREPHLERRCESCHSRDDAHDGQLGPDCGGCHGPESFVTRVFFDHGITRFPLLGLHALVGCEDCHASARFEDAPSGCADCHDADDVHRGALGSDCVDCHNANGWRVWRFDHDAETRFPLVGRHAGLACDACHSSRRGPFLTQKCDSCHARDDAHRGSFGRDCGLCHGADAWRPARIGRRTR